MNAILTISNYQAFFYILNLVITIVNDEETLEKIISKISSISLEEAYSYKKEMKVKIIKKIESLKNQKGESRIFEAETIEKTTKNLMAFVGQAFKKITSQGGTEKEETKTVEEKK